MNFEKFTIKAQEVISKAQEIAQAHQQQAIEPAHILKAILLVDDNIPAYVLKKLSVNVSALDTVVSKMIDRLPVVTGGSLYLSPKSEMVLQKAIASLGEFKDEFVSDHLRCEILR